MIRADLLKRLDALSRHYTPEPIETIRVIVSEMYPVPEGDPRMGSVEVKDDNPSIKYQPTVMYCRDEEHHSQMVDEYYGTPPHTTTILITNDHPARKDDPRHADWLNSRQGNNHETHTESPLP